MIQGHDQVGPAVKANQKLQRACPRAGGVCIQYHHVCDPVPELRIQFRNRGFETIPQDLSKLVTAFVARLGFRRDLHMSAEPAEPPGESLWLL